MLVEHRRELLNEIQSRVRDVREEGASDHHRSTDVGETLEVEPENDLAFALIQIKVEALERVNDAVRRFDEGTYGYCVDCGEVIRAFTAPRDALCDPLQGLRGDTRAFAAPRTYSMAANVVWTRLAILRALGFTPACGSQAESRGHCHEVRQANQPSSCA